MPVTKRVSKSKAGRAGVVVQVRPVAPDHDEEIWPNARRAARPVATRILLLDAHPVVRAGVAALLSLEPDLQIVAEARSVASACACLATQSLDLIIAELGDVLRGDPHGLATLRAACGETPILILSIRDEDEDVMVAMSTGATSYVSKSAGREVLLEAVRATREQRQYLDPRLVKALIDSALRRSQPPVQAQAAPLSEEERLIVSLLARGASKRTISRRLRCTGGLAEERRIACVNRLGLSNQQMVVTFALQRGLVGGEIWNVSSPAAIAAGRQPLAANRWNA